MATVWNPADETGVTLSDSNHIATNTAGGNFGVRGAPTSHGTSDPGKFYLEFSTIAFPSGAGGSSLGFTNPSAALGAGSDIGVTHAGDVYGTVAHTQGNIGVPPWSIIGFAVDTINFMLWATLDGVTWFGRTGLGTPNPATATAGADLTGYTSPLLPHIWFSNVFGGTGTCTINAGDRPFSFAIPSGFAAWDAPPPPFTFGQSRVIA